MTTKDEIKNRISMALRDPVLQQGFEIICRENDELERENEEMSKDYAISRTYPKFETSHIANFVLREVEGAFLAGLKAGKDMNGATKWHDLLKNPTDVPKENVTVLLLTEVEPVTARYDNKYEAFFRLNDKLNYCVFIAPMSYIAWCEIPKFEE